MPLKVAGIDVRLMVEFYKMNKLFFDMESFREFLKTLPQGSYPPRELERLGFENELEEWLTVNSRDSAAFFALSFHGDGKNAASGDEWKKAKLWKCLAHRVLNEQTLQFGKTTGFKAWRMTFVRADRAPIQKVERLETGASPM